MLVAAGVVQDLLAQLDQVQVDLAQPTALEVLEVRQVVQYLAIAISLGFQLELDTEP